MKKISVIILLFVAIASSFLTSCSSDTTSTPPTITAAVDNASPAVGAKVVFTIPVSTTNGMLKSIGVSLPNNGTPGTGSAFEASSDLDNTSMTASSANFVTTSNIMSSTVKYDLVIPSGASGTWIVTFTVADDKTTNTNQVTLTVSPIATWGPITVAQFAYNTSLMANKNLFGADGSQYSLNDIGSNSSKIDFVVMRHTYAKGDMWGILSPDNSKVQSSTGLYAINGVTFTWPTPKTTKLMSTTLDIATVTAAQLTALDFTSATGDMSDVAPATNIAFKTSDGKIGLIKVNSENSTSNGGIFDGTISVSGVYLPASSGK